jgi:hypothetical protein
MNIAYGYTGYNYSVILASNYAFAWIIRPYGQIFASVAGVDRIYPNASYLFVLQYNYGSREYVAYANQKGSGISDQM